MRLLRALRFVIMAGMPVAFMLPSASAQETTQSIAVGPADRAAAASVSPSGIHGLSLSNGNRHALWTSGKPSNSASAFSIGPAIPPAGFYPGDLSNPASGPTIQYAQSHGLYVNCKPSCWGTPAKFLSDLEHSDMIHLTDAYVGAFANNRYSVGNGALLTGSLPHILYDADILAIAHAGASIFGTGYRHIYHIYLPPGQDVCITGTSPLQCYSPDDLTTFYFCAYHGSVDFSDIGHVLLTVEPYTNVNGCQVVPPSPNGAVVDSTANVLSHELFETITDPDLDAWWNHFDLALFGAEIGDECADFDFGYSFVSLAGKKYEIQPEYSNSTHSCVFSAYAFP